MLHLVDEVLRQALEPVLRDLRNSGIAAPRIEDVESADDADMPSAMLRSPGGSGMGVNVNPTALEFERVAHVADQVQEWVIEELWGHAPTNWPRCPTHPNRHPLQASTPDGMAAWMCPSDDMPIAPIGGLEGLSS
jgi:hypothetical protein